MFVVSEANPLGYAAARTKTNNLNDVYDIVLNITNDAKEAQWALETASEMGFGGQCIRFRYKLECIREY